MLPIGPLMIEHRLIEKMINVMKGQLDHIQTGKPVSSRLIETITDFIRAYADRCHHGKEEDILFRELAKKTISSEHRRIIEQLSEEHTKGRKLTKTLVEANQKYKQGDQKALPVIILHIGHIANIVRERKNGNKAYYITIRHINYSNICKNRCKFCAFSKDKAASGSYEMALEEILEKAMAAVEEGATELHIVGGLHPDLPFDFYVKMIHEIHEICPDVHIQAFTAVEIEHLSQIARLSVPQTLKELKEAGLGSLPGGGAEVFSPKIREQLCPEKLSGEGWLQLMREAHTMGLRRLRGLLPATRC